VLLYVNCEPVGEEPLQLVDSRIDLNGQILISKLVESEATQAIDLQWMVMACDPNSVERETCDELPVGGRPSPLRLPSRGPSLRSGSRAR
jgi:hypothetical protein